MTFALLAVFAVAWSLTVLRWSIARRTSPWRRRAVAVSAVAGALAIVSAAIDLRSIWMMSSAPRSRVTISLRDMGSWWQVSYLQDNRRFLTANEIHVPTGALVTMEWVGPPVILWRLPMELGRFAFVPNGNEDLVVLQLWPPMRRHLRIVADPQFKRWFAEQEKPARFDPAAADMFNSAGCAYCHVIRGVAESPWRVAPDLTHFGSRQTIDATGMPNRRGFLAGWIVHSGALKRRSQMPENAVRADVLNHLLKDLESRQ